MGFLNSDSITVDAILTKFGRRKLAEGGTLGIAKFALSDDGVNYELWNTAHPSGSNKYGAAITDTPQLEAFPDDSVVMKYKLLDLDRSTVFLPRLSGVPKSFNLIDQTTIETIIPTTINGQDSTYSVVVPQSEHLYLQGGTVQNKAATTRFHSAKAEIPYFTEIRLPAGQGLKIKAAPTDAIRKGYIMFTGHQTGATATVTYEISKNILGVAAANVGV